MIQRYGLGPTVETRRRENAVGEVVLKVDVFVEEQL